MELIVKLNIKKQSWEISTIVKSDSNLWCHKASPKTIVTKKSPKQEKKYGHMNELGEHEFKEWKSFEKGTNVY